MKDRFSTSAKERQLIFFQRINMEPLRGYQRTKESTFGAVGNIVGGAGQVITGTNGRFRGALRIGQGVLDVADVIPSIAADGIRSLGGTPSHASTSTRFNVTRAIGDLNIRTDDPVHVIKDTASYTAGLVHAVVFKPVSDVLRGLQSLN